MTTLPEPADAKSEVFVAWHDAEKFAEAVTKVRNKTKQDAADLSSIHLLTRSLANLKNCAKAHKDQVKEYKRMRSWLTQLKADKKIRTMRSFQTQNSVQ